MAALDGRVVIVTGAGRGIGREHALLLAAEGARVVVNDVGGLRDGTGADASPASTVVDEIKAAGGTAIANLDDVADWEGAQRLVQSAVDEFGRLDVVVNNAGILRDRMLVNMSEQEWDAVIRVHLRGHFCVLRHAAAYWREQSKAGTPVRASVINTSSTSGLFGAVGQINYGSAKMAIAALTTISNAELQRYGVRVNAISPLARTRMTEDLGGRSTQRPDPGEFDDRDPANVSPWVCYLAMEDCSINGRTFLVYGGTIQLFHPFAIVDGIQKDGRWTLDELIEKGPRLGDVPFEYGSPVARIS
jgi:NAD(P)-dependent dehydrogenase (short-subunit alcohol dehydrogenase family)